MKNSPAGKKRKMLYTRHANCLIARSVVVGRRKTHSSTQRPTTGRSPRLRLPRPSFREIPRAQLTASDVQGWLQETVESSKAVRLAETDAAWTLVAEEPFREGDTLLTLHQDKWISVDTVSQSGIGPLVQNLDPWLQLALFLLSQKSDPSSPWQSYLTHLPQNLASPAFWSDEELESIKGTQLHESAVGYRQFFSQRYTELDTELFIKHPDRFGKGDFDYDSFCWAVGIVRSQIRPPMDGEKIALIPVTSHIAHSRDGNVEWILNSGNLFNPTKALSLKATREIQSGEQLKMDYGVEKSDSQIALDYGAVDIVNQQGGYQLSLQLPESDTNYDDKMDVLDVCGMEEPMVFEFLPNADPSNDLLVFLRLLNLSGPDAFHLEAIFRNEVEDHLAFPVSPENEANVCASMISGCEEALKAYVSTSAIPVSTEKQSLMKQVCQGEQRTLEWIQSWFLKRKDSLEELEYYAERRLKRLGLIDDGNISRAVHTDVLFSSDGSSTFEGMWKDGIA